MYNLKKVYCFILAFLIVLCSIPGRSFSASHYKVPYIILTTDKLIKSAKIIASIRNKKYDVKIITTQAIGSNSQKDIRDYLKKYVFRQGYLLILGSEKLIPRPAMYPSPTVHSVSFEKPGEIKTDLYYALLNEDIDKDKDGFPGELYDDRMEINPDLFVGRIPFDSNEEIEKIIKKTLQFEESSPQNALLAASFISYPKEIYQGAQIFNGDGAREEELISRLIPCNVIKLYEKSGSFPSIYDDNLPLTKENFYANLPQAGFIDWVAHGSSSAAYREIWDDKNQDGIPENSEYTFKSFISKDDNFMANGIFFSGSCLNENGTDNLGKAILKKGGVAFIGATGISFSPSYFAHSDDGGTGSINYYFVKNLVSGETVGASLYTAFKDFFTNDFYSDIEDPLAGSLVDIYDYNLYGDPAIVWRVDKQNKLWSNKSIKKFKNDITMDINDKKDVTFTLNVPEKMSFFILFPRGIYIKSSTEKDSIIDNAFNIIRLNNAKGRITFKGIARGDIKGKIIIKDAVCSGKVLGDVYQNVYIKGYNIRDINMDGKINESDLKIIEENFGKTYMDRGFNFFADLNNDYKVDGEDLFMFLFP